MPTLQDIELKLDDYLLLPDKSVVKLLAAFCIGIRLPTPQPWLFLAAGSSHGKTELLTLLKYIPGYTQVDDLTKNTLISGAKSYEGNNSLLARVPEGGFLMFSDFTTLLAKNKDELAAIMGQLRPVYDGEFTKATGNAAQSTTIKKKIGLLGGCTDVIYTKAADFADMGQRMLIFHLPMTDNYEVGRFNFAHRKKNRKEQQEELRRMMSDYIKSFPVSSKYEDLPDFDEQTELDILDIAHLAVSARSVVEREQYDRDHKQKSRLSPEGIGRVQKQLMSVAYGLMLQNPDKQLNSHDRKILYKLGLDCIDPRRREVLQLLTTYQMGGDINRIADGIRYHRDTTKIFVEDLFTLGLVEKSTLLVGARGRKDVYKIKEPFGTIMTRFENIKVVKEELPESEEEKLEKAQATPMDEPDWMAQAVTAAKEVNMP